MKKQDFIKEFYSKVLGVKFNETENPVSWASERTYIDKSWHGTYRIAFKHRDFKFKDAYPMQIKAENFLKKYGLSEDKIYLNVRTRPVCMDSNYHFLYIRCKELPWRMIDTK